MSAKKRTKAIGKSTESPGQGDITLVGVARTVGSTFGTAVARAEGAAKEIETITHSVSKSTLAATQKLYKRAKKKLRAASWKSTSKKRKASKARSGQSAGRGK
ncbi:MAG TPA: hypothetical protein VKV95_06405 [Terriglobia bacterium]|nr:hypothetical protein [Terriglobia bacterium]